MADDNGAVTREPLTRERLLAAALDLVDRDGLDRLTMRNLGRELGVDPMAAYHWFPNKRAILQGLYEAILGEVVVPVEVEGGWPEALKAIAHSFHRALLAHPNAVPMISIQPVTTLGGLRLVERAASLLVRSGLTPALSIEVINGVAALVIGSVLAEPAVTPGVEPMGAEEMAALFTSLPAEEFPTLVAARDDAGSGALARPSRFGQLLDALVLGLEVQLGAPRTDTR